jgi:hypothetical protein
MSAGAAAAGFSRVLGLMRGFGVSAHMMNYVLIGSLAVGPLLAYAAARAPSQEQVEAELRETRGEQLKRIERATDKINTFWKVKRNSSEMEGVYASLLHGGKGEWKRHYELGRGSALSDAEAAQSPELARMQRLLALPQTPEERKEAEAAEAERAKALAAAPPAAAAAAAASAEGLAAGGAASGTAAAAAGVAAAATAASGAAPDEKADLAKGRRSWLPFT